ncbi:glutathione S-transferase family protein [Umezakia ovalisporum]|uniref:glutathione S-transferase family protein n=1 Tax=Umezakia ovalisporum TaxID=75695 RepID=UPI0035BA93D4
MLLLQFSTSHYCRKARLALGYKQINYKCENLTPGLHILRLRAMTGLKTLPVLLPQIEGKRSVIPDSTEILKFLENYQKEPSFLLPDYEQQTQAWMLEDWLDESVGTATRFVYYQFRAGEGKEIDPSVLSQIVISVVRQQYGINQASVGLAKNRLATAFSELSIRWEKNNYLVGNRLSVVDIAAAALLSPLALIPEYRQGYPWLFERLVQVHELCHEPLPPGL